MFLDEVVSRVLRKPDGEILGLVQQGKHIAVEGGIGIGVPFAFNLWIGFNELFIQRDFLVREAFLFGRAHTFPQAINRMGKRNEDSITQVPTAQNFVKVLASVSVSSDSGG